MATTPVSYDLLRAEPWWGREFAPPNLEALYAGLRLFLGRGADAVGGKGDNRHRYGYHRSREWILNSAHSVYGIGDYSVAGPLDLGGDDRWLSALDATPSDVETLIGMCQRLDRAVKAGLLPQVREWYGNLDGDKSVDGWDAVRRRVASSDSSHLWHLHISFYRSRADWNHSNLLATLTGDDDMGLPDRDAQALAWRAEAIINNRPAVIGGPTRGEANHLAAALTALGVAVGGGAVDLAAVSAAASDGARAGALAAADDLAAAILAKLPVGDDVRLTLADVEFAVRAVFADAAD